MSSIFFTSSPVGALPRKAQLPFDVIIIRLMSHFINLSDVFFNLILFKYEHLMMSDI
uniref:Uncharacterized protein n=1 Tax=Klebsiella aerogenes TaxID=548 RepID=A0A2R4NCH8_KLEAE|nr:Hypothetical protein [Klebsiella aerogenes]